MKGDRTGRKAAASHGDRPVEAQCPRRPIVGHSAPAGDLRPPAGGGADSGVRDPRRAIAGEVHQPDPAEYVEIPRARADGIADPVNGIRQFTVGTGGAELYNFIRITTNSEERIMKHGVMHLTLRPAQIDWEFLGIDGSVADRGLDTCR